MGGPAGRPKAALRFLSGPLPSKQEGQLRAEMNAWKWSSSPLLSHSGFSLLLMRGFQPSLRLSHHYLLKLGTFTAPWFPFCS